MSTETPAPTPEPTETPTATVETTDEPLRAPGLKALDAERAARAAADKALADLRREIEDSKKSTEQRVADDLAAAQRTAQESAAKALRYEVAAAKGIDLALAARLQGSTQAELEADADALMALIPRTPEQSPRGPHVPTEGTHAEAGRGVTQASETDLLSMTPEQVNQARRDGRLNKLLGIS
jgi:hypothetical protein